MVLSAGSIYSETFKTVRNLLSDNVPVASGVYSVFPDIQGDSFSYPIVVVDRSKISQTGKTFGLQNRKLTINVPVMCYALSGKDLDDLIDDVDFALTRNQRSLNTSGLNNMKLNSSDSDDVIINDKKVHVMLMNAGFEWWGDI